MNEQDALTPAQARAQRVDNILNTAWDDYTAGAISANDLRAVVYSCLYFGRFRRWPSGLEYNLQDHYSIAPTLGKINTKSYEHGDQEEQQRSKKPSLEILHDICFEVFWLPKETGGDRRLKTVFNFTGADGKGRSETFAEYVRRLAENKKDRLRKAEWTLGEEKLEREIQINDEDAGGDNEDLPWDGSLNSDSDLRLSSLAPPVRQWSEHTPLLADLYKEADKKGDEEALARVKLLEQQYRALHPVIANHHLRGIRNASEIEGHIRAKDEPSRITGRKAIRKAMDTFEALAGLSKKQTQTRRKTQDDFSTWGRRPGTPKASPTSVLAFAAAERAEAKGEPEPGRDQIPMGPPKIVTADLTPDPQFSWTWECTIAGERRSSVGKDTGKRRDEDEAEEEYQEEA